MPVVRQRCSWGNGSSLLVKRESWNTSWAVVKLMPCLRMFSLSFSGSQVHRKVVFPYFGAARLYSSLKNGFGHLRYSCQEVVDLVRCRLRFLVVRAKITQVAQVLDGTPLRSVENLGAFEGVVQI